MNKENQGQLTKELFASIVRDVDSSLCPASKKRDLYLVFTKPFLEQHGELIKKSFPQTTIYQLVPFGDEPIIYFKPE